MQRITKESLAKSTVKPTLYIYMIYMMVQRKTKSVKVNMGLYHAKTPKFSVPKNSHKTKPTKQCTFK